MTNVKVDFHRSIWLLKESEGINDFVIISHVYLHERK